MSKHEMNSAERKALEAANRILSRLSNGVALSDLPIGPQSKRRNKYLYFESDDAWRFCYTPWKDSDGWYYAFTYRPYGKGSRSGNATQWRLINKVRFRMRKSAEARAAKRHNKRKEMLRDK